jgi:hypothetical protein
MTEEFVLSHFLNFYQKTFIKSTFFEQTNFMKTKRMISWYTFQKVYPLAKYIKKTVSLAQVWHLTYPGNYQKKYNYEKPIMKTTIESFNRSFNNPLVYSGESEPSIPFESEPL